MNQSDLLKALEGASGPALYLDIEVAKALVPQIIVMRQRDDDSGADPFTYRKFTTCVDDALWLLDVMLPGTFFLFGKGRTRPDEPLFGFQILTSEVVMGENEVIAEAEHDCAAICILIALLRALDVQGASA